MAYIEERLLCLECAWLGCQEGSDSANECQPLPGFEEFEMHVWNIYKIKWELDEWKRMHVLYERSLCEGMSVCMVYLLNCYLIGEQPSMQNVQNWN